jgi:SOS-response transcriptional repressor LexA
MVVAGWPSPAEEELGDMLTFEEWLVPHKESSCLVTVATNALRSEGILPDDLVIMERGRKPQHGDIVVAEIDGAPIIRRYESGSGVLRLTSDIGEQILSEESDIRLLGVVTSVIRKYR